VKVIVPELLTASGPTLAPYLPFAGLAFALALTGMFVRRFRGGGPRLPPVVAAASVALSLLAMLVAAWWVGLREVMPTPERPSELIDRLTAAQRDYQESLGGSSLLSGGGGGEVPLEPNAVAPPLEAAGWLNGLSPDNLAGRFVVVDAFDDLCPMCRQGAPVMIEAYEKFRGEVVFLSLTTKSRAQAAEFAAATGVEWPIGYGAMAAIHALGAGAPTVFIIGPTVASSGTTTAPATAMKSRSLPTCWKPPSTARWLSDR
jgi:hypothetical protein